MWIPSSGSHSCERGVTPRSAVAALDSAPLLVCDACVGGDLEQSRVKLSVFRPCVTEFHDGQPQLGADRALAYDFADPLSLG